MKPFNLIDAKFGEPILYEAYHLDGLHEATFVAYRPEITDGPQVCIVVDLCINGGYGPLYVLVQEDGTNGQFGRLHMKEPDDETL